MKTRTRLSPLLWIAALLILGVVCFFLFRPKPIDPHAGQVHIDTGTGMIWMTPVEGFPVNTLGPDCFTQIDGVPTYTGEDYEVRRGIDITYFQGDIDWALAAKNIDFVFISMGYRGYTEGGLFEDKYFRRNYDGAVARGLDVGVYFFSQAVNVQEALEEADFVLKLLDGRTLSLPVVFDWEPIDGGGARTDGLAPEIINDCAAAFCEKVRLAGYEPCVYFNRFLGYYKYDFSRLRDYRLWMAAPGTYPDFYYAFDFWQYSLNAEIPGVPTETDANLYFIPKQSE